MQTKEISDLYLNYFIKYSNKLEDLYLVKRDEFSKEWIEKKVLLAKQALSFYKFGNELILNKFKDENESRFYFFYLDLIMSKLKHSIFTEIPKTENIDIYIILYKDDLAFTGERLKEYDIKKDRKIFDIEFQRFVFKSFLMMDFIYYDDYGIFTRFSLNKKLFIYNKSVFNFQGNSLRGFGSEIIRNFLSNTLKFYQIEHDNPYKEIVALSKKEKIYEIEPFGYYLAFKIWKFAKIIKSTLEFNNNNERKMHKKQFNRIIKEYINNSLFNIEKFYNKKIDNLTLFYKFYELDSQILNLLLKDILHKYEKINFQIPSLELDQYTKQYIKSKSIEEILCKTINNDVYEKYKLYRLLESKDITVDDITYLYENLVDNIDFKDYDIMAMLKGGVLLSHIINISKNLNKIIYIFSSYPYISVLPRTLLSEKSNSIIIDESIKSGFSFRLFAMYKKRVLNNYLNNNNFDYKLFSLVDFVDFGKKEKEYKLSKIANIEVIDKKLHIKIVKQNFNTTIFNWNSFFNNLNEINKEEFRKFAIINNRFDITRLLSISKYYFQIAKYFAVQLKSEKSEKIALYHTSDEGAILAQGIAFVYKTLYNDKKIILSKDKILKENKVFFVDMSIDTVHTIKRSFKIDFQDNNFEHLQKAFVIYASKKAQEELKDKIYFIDSLRIDNV